MNTTARIQHKGQVTIPTRLREQAGLNKGDVVEFTYQEGKIVITPKMVIDRRSFPNADDEYTPEQRRSIDARLAKAEGEINQGRAFGPFESHEDFLGALHKEAAKLDKKKTKRPTK